MTEPSRYAQKLSRENCCAAFVDYLTEFLPGLRTMEPEHYDNNVKGYTLSMRALGVPHCVLGDEGSFRGEFFPIIKQEFAAAPRFERHAPSAWTSKPFRDWLAATGRPKVILGGISIDNCTSLTSFDLIANGYEVYVVVDASGAESDLVERSAIQRLMQAGATPVNWVQIACEIMGDWQTPEGPEIGRILKEHSRYGALGVPQA